ncbi:MAG: ABC transporter ATP-binding protein [Rikenellaceae bacterium]|nr:ABC transporter ATP-binding protein [Rikenellaceae bacterium]
MEQNELIRIENLSVTYDGKTALEWVNLSLSEGEFVAIVGPNGGGKSTLVKAILGLVPYCGRIEFAPEVADRAAIGYMPQMNNFDRAFPISVGELILSGLQGDKGHAWGRYSAEDKAKVAEVARLLGIYTLIDKAIGELSGGELQRALLGRAIISEPKVLVLDEPANFIDPKFEGELYELLTELNKRITIVMVSHDEAAVRSLAHRVVCINRTIQPSPAY